MATCTPQTLMDSAACFACLPENQLQAINASLLCQIAISLGAMATCDPSTLASNAACLACLTPQQLSLIQTQLMCEILTAINSGALGNGCVLCGTSDPVDDPDCDCALYYRTDNGGVWFWNGLLWKALIAA